MTSSSRLLFGLSSVVHTGALASYFVDLLILKREELHHQALRVRDQMMSFLPQRSFPYSHFCRLIFASK